MKPRNFAASEPTQNVAQETIISTDPSTGQEIWRGESGNVDDAVALARKSWPSWAAQPLANRMEALRRFANEVLKEADNLAELISRETGKPLWEARNEVEMVQTKVEISIKSFAERTGQRRLDSALQGASSLRHKPHGVMAVLTPFTMPAQLASGHILPALLAGNAVVFKPSEKAVAVGELLTKCFHRAGISAAIVQMLVGGPETGKQLIAHPGIDGVLFTGSAQAGIWINRKLATSPGKIAALEMGGNNPLVLWHTPKISDAAVLVVQSAFASAGQRCTAARRLIIQAEMYDAAMEEIKKLADRLIVGSPFDNPTPFMGPVIDADTADRMTDSFIYLMSKGGKAIKHMTRPKGDLPFLSPAIMDVTAMEERPDVELFGPLLQVVKVHDFDEAIAEANRTRFGLCASLVGGTPQEYNRFWANIRAGVINWNRPTNAVSSAAPIGGIGLSGNNRPTGFYAADYSAYPVSSFEVEQPRASIGVGLRG